MAKVSHRSEEALLEKLQRWIDELGRKPTLADLIESQDVELMAAYTLKLFRNAAREAVLRRLRREANFIGSSIKEPGNPVLRVFDGISKAWSLTPAEQLALLGLESHSSLDEVKSASEAELPIIIIERVAVLLTIFETINILLPNSERADAWMRSPNAEPPFGGRAALEVMADGLSELYQVERYLLAERWGA